MSDNKVTEKDLVKQGWRKGKDNLWFWDTHGVYNSLKNGLLFSDAVILAAAIKRWKTK